MTLYILIAVAVVAVLFVALVMTRPPHFRVTRSATIAAPPEVVFGYVNDLHRFQEWSPWAKMDPGATVTFEGPSAGQGASFSWSGRKVGAGKMTVLDSVPSRSVRFRLDFLKPMTATNTAEFTFEPEGDLTLMTWSMSGRNNFVGKFFNLIINCEKMCGDQFEQGLANLNALVKEPAGKSSPSLAASAA